MRNLNLPDHTPAPETLAFAHELAVLAATQTGDETMSDELAALATAMRDARTDANVLYDLLERAFNVAAVVKPAVNVLTGEVKSLRQQVDALTSERDEMQFGELRQLVNEILVALGSPDTLIGPLSTHNLRVIKRQIEAQDSK